MQLLVKLALDRDSNILALHEDDEHIIPPETYPAGLTVLRFIDTKYIIGHTTLRKEWRESLPQIVASEALRRVNVVFPLLQQSTASLELTHNIISYGSDIGLWPMDAQERQKEIKRGLDYVATLRSAARALADKHVNNPCDDINWPTAIDPIKL